jgi:hypothetical protein
MVVEADKEDTAAKDVADEKVEEEAEKEVKQQQAGWMMMNFSRCPDARTKYFQERRK